MAEYHVGAGAFGIYAGTLNKNKTLWQNKTECTDEALEAVRDWIIRKELGGINSFEKNKGGYEWTLEDGKIVRLIVEVEYDTKSEEA